MAIAAVLLIGSLLAGCAGTGGQGGAGDKVIKLADVQWQTLWINNAIAGYIMEQGYGYKVETIEMTTPIMQQALVKGDVDVVMETWTANIIDWYNGAMQKNQILTLGPIIEKGVQAWYVPRYVIEGDASRGLKPLAPDLKSVSDLPKYKHLFADPENPNKGLLISCITGWNCAVVNQVKLHGYGLAEHYNVQEPGASAALDAAIAGAYRRGEPLLTYYWEPTWLLGAYDMVRLEEPAFNETCNEITQKVISGTMKLADVPKEGGCAFPEDDVFITAHPSLKTRAPEVAEFLSKMTVGNEVLNKLSAYMELEKKSAEETAVWFFENYQAEWRSWVPADVAQKLEDALRKDGAKL